jgi:RNA polymerase sigma-54 factor
MLQLAALPADTPYLAEAMELVKNHLEVLASRDFGKLRKVLRCDDDCLRAVQTHHQPQPRPGRDFSSHALHRSRCRRKTKGVWVASLNPDAMPRLRINRLYADILQRNRGAGTQQLASQLQEAKWLIKNVQQRFDTILRVAQAIVDRQRHFFEHGEVAMRPLVLREIAEALDLHESTVSRVTTQNFMHTPRGNFELKYFRQPCDDRGGRIGVDTAMGALIKQLSVRKLAQAAEDSQISDLRAQGIASRGARS